MKLTAYMNHDLGPQKACQEVTELLEAGHVIAAMAAGEALLRCFGRSISTKPELKDLADIYQQALHTTNQVLASAKIALATLPEAEVHGQARAFVTELGEAFRPDTPDYLRRSLVVDALGAMKGLDAELDPVCTFLPALFKGKPELLEELAAQLPGSFVIPLELAEHFENTAKSPKAGAKLRAAWSARAIEALSAPGATDPRATWVDLFLREELGSKSWVLGKLIARALAEGNLADAHRHLEVLQRTLPEDDDTKRASLMVLAQEARNQPTKRSEFLASLSAELATLVEDGQPDTLDDEMRPSTAELLVQRACLLASDDRPSEALDDLRRGIRLHPAIAKRIGSEPSLASVCGADAARDVLAAKPEALLTTAERTEAHLVRAIRATVQHAGDIDIALSWSERAVLVARAEGSDDWKARAMAARSRILFEHEETRAAKAALETAEAAAAGAVTALARAEVALARAMATRDAGGKPAKVAYEAARVAARACGPRSAIVGSVADETSRYLNGIDAPLEEIVAVLEEGITALNGFIEDHPARDESDRDFGAACVDLMALLASRAYVSMLREEPSEVGLELLRRATVAVRGAHGCGYFFSDDFMSTLLNLALTLEAASHRQGEAGEDGVVSDFFDALDISPRVIEEKRFFRGVRQLANAMLPVMKASGLAELFGAAVTENLTEELATEDHAELVGLSLRAKAWPGFMTAAAIRFRLASRGGQSLSEALDEVEALAMSYVDDEA